MLRLVRGFAMVAAAPQSAPTGTTKLLSGIVSGILLRPPLPEATGRSLVICGPPGVGKTFTISRLMHEFPARVRLCPSLTTRPPRDGEVQGMHYHFVSDEEFAEELRKGNLIEHVSLYGHQYGTSRRVMQEIHDKHLLCLLDLNIDGARALKDVATCVYIKPDTIEELAHRMALRLTPEDEIERRLAHVEQHIAEAEKSGVFHHIISKTWEDI
eukprot:m.285241 g.285241  ORF g.285241 m.285241 type:complete len:213 (-) comp11332_c0_seq1:362-1000(-)